MNVGVGVGTLFDRANRANPNRSVLLFTGKLSDYCTAPLAEHSWHDTTTMSFDKIYCSHVPYRMPSRTEEFTWMSEYDYNRLID